MRNRKIPSRLAEHRKRDFFFGLISGSFLLICALFAYAYFKNGTPRHILKPDYQNQDAIKSPEIIALEKKIRASESAARRKIKLKIPIFMYHYVEYVKDENDYIRKSLDINPFVFEQQLKTLAENGYTTYFAKEIPDILEGKIPYSTKSAVLTFDDGYEDFFTDAFPLLEKYKIKGTVYVISNYIGRRGFLSGNQLKLLAASEYVEIGSHTMDHAYLKGMFYDYAKDQIFDSKSTLEEIVGRRVETFAYPFGAFDEQSAKLVEQAGYKLAVSVIHGSEQSFSNIFFLNRIRAGFLGMGGDYMLRQMDSFVK